MQHKKKLAMTQSSMDVRATLSLSHPGFVCPRRATVHIRVEYHLLAGVAQPQSRFLDHLPNLAQTVNIERRASNVGHRTSNVEGRAANNEQ